MTRPTLAEAMTALSVATDFAMSHSAHFGCNVDTQLMAALVGDELAIRREFSGIDTADRWAVARLLLRRLGAVHRDAPTLRAAFSIARVMLTTEARMAEFFAGHCEVGQKLGERICLPPEVVASLAQLYERWDGKGLPNRLRGAAVSPVALIVSLAQDIVVHHDAGGWKAVEVMVRARRGGAHDPRMADAFLSDARTLLAVRSTSRRCVSAPTTSTGCSRRVPECGGRCARWPARCAATVRPWSSSAFRTPTRRARSSTNCSAPAARPTCAGSWTARARTRGSRN